MNANYSALIASAELFKKSFPQSERPRAFIVIYWAFCEFSINNGTFFIIISQFSNNNKKKHTPCLMKKRFLLLLTTFTVIISHLFHTARGIISYFIFSGVNLIFLQKSGLAILHFYQVNAAVRRHTSMPEMFRILVQVLEKSPHCTSMGRHQNRFVCQRRI